MSVTSNYMFTISDEHSLTMDRILVLANEVIEEFSIFVNVQVFNEKLVYIDYGRYSTTYYFEFEYRELND